MPRYQYSQPLPPSLPRCPPHANCPQLKLIQLPALPPSFEQTPTAQQELLLGREVLEQGVLLSLHKQDEAAMERSFAQLRTYYNDTRALLPASPSEVTMQGLNLLRLLVQNRIAEFHTELELIPPQAQQDSAILQPVQLEQWLMEGAYNKVLAASREAASEVHGMLLAQLATTVRDEAASCSEKAYERLRVPDAQKLLLFDNDAEVREYANEHGWTITPDDYIVFRAAAAEGTAASKAIPSLELINNALVYAKELERIV
ncbi:26S proteasome regulatory complex [Volvox carteri f. nagariensis]|uniref:26S proteasome regulatory complex n=1 Tax=Volvox carteri f. nagariensis TaxID=3068 RepID=D8UB46_VOLCA|nr:26S proteasome regulatory complex [Volvox carteri f. nagariensis]EFJ43044.1 26S proteasome regulatory complex [Volvox carteri f. nagariensis]|eukprot:XP_002955843.1 26S proteasome regulatory complex [Volvox carteri f. nagariensis]